MLLRISTQCGIAECILVLFVEKVGGASCNEKAAGQVVVRGHIEARVTGVRGLRGIHEIGIRAHAGEIADEVPIHARDIQIDSEGARIHRAANQVIAGLQRGIGEGIFGLHHARVVVSVIAVDEEPLARAKFGNEVDAAGKSEVGIKKGAISKLAGWIRLAETAWGTIREADDVVKTSVEIVNGNFPAIRSELLIETGGPALACLGLEIGIARKAGIGARGLIEAGLLDSLAVKGAVTRVAEETFAIVKRIGTSNTGSEAGAKLAVGFDSSAEIEGEARNRCVTEVEVPGLIVATQMAGRDVSILDFVLVADCGDEFARDVARLRVERGAIEGE